MLRKSSNWGKICFDLCDLDFLTSDLDLDITSVNGNNSCKFHGDPMTEI